MGILIGINISSTMLVVFQQTFAERSLQTSKLSKLETTTHRPSSLPTGVKWRATSVAKNIWKPWWFHWFLWRRKPVGNNFLAGKTSPSFSFSVLVRKWRGLAAVIFHLSILNFYQTTKILMVKLLKLPQITIIDLYMLVLFLHFGGRQQQIALCWEIENNFSLQQVGGTSISGHINQEEEEQFKSKLFSLCWKIYLHLHLWSYKSGRKKRIQGFKSKCIFINCWMYLYEFENVFVWFAISICLNWQKYLCKLQNVFAPGVGGGTSISGHINQEEERQFNFTKER